jgi:hypothetical protein
VEKSFGLKYEETEVESHVFVFDPSRAIYYAYNQPDFEYGSLKKYIQDVDAGKIEVS